MVNIKKILLMFLFFCTLSSILYSWSIDVALPKWQDNRPAWGNNNNSCYPYPIITGQNPPQSIEVKFKVSPTWPWETPEYYYTVKLIQFGNETYSNGPYYHSGDDEVSSFIPFSSFCYNTNAEIRIIVNYDNDIRTENRYVRVYSPYSSTNCPAGTPKAACENPNITMTGNSVVGLGANCCDNWSGGANVTAQRYRIEFTVNGDFANKTITIDNELSYGTDVSAIVDNCKWAGIKSQSSSQVVFFTFAYNFTLPGGQNYWWPCRPEQTAVAYRVYSGPIPPIIDRLEQTPTVIFKQFSGQMKCWLRQGENTQYRWWNSYKPTFMWDNSSGNTSNIVQISNNYSGLTDDGDAYGQYGLRCSTWNSGGYSDVSKEVVYSTNSGGGCPFLFVQDTDSIYSEDNNLLHKSEMSSFSADIFDQYKLNIQPGIFNEIINCKIVETTSDYNYFDKIGLTAIDYPFNKKIAITENGQIVMYDPTEILSSGDASLNTVENITKYIYYGNQNDSVVDGGDGDNILLNEIDGLPPQTGDSLAFIILVGRDEDRIIPYPAYKDYAGTISIFADGSERPIEIPFARRENKSEVIIPFASTSASIDSAIIVWNRDFAVEYISVVPITYSGFTSTELLMNDAYHPTDQDAYLKLLNTDQNYLELDSLSHINLSFISIPFPDGNYERCYIFQTTGRYTVPDMLNGRPNSLNNNNSSIIPYKNMLYLNYPNPFNPSTRISYEINKNSNVNISVYNILGQLVRVLVNEFKSAGNYNVDFDGSNLSSGIYIYRIETPFFTDVKKMVLLK